MNDFRLEVRGEELWLKHAETGRDLAKFVDDAAAETFLGTLRLIKQRGAALLYVAPPTPAPVKELPEAGDYILGPV